MPPSPPPSSLQKVKSKTHNLLNRDIINWSEFLSFFSLSFCCSLQKKMCQKAHLMHVNDEIIFSLFSFFYFEDCCKLNKKIHKLLLCGHKYWFELWQRVAHTTRWKAILFYFFFIYFWVWLCWFIFLNFSWGVLLMKYYSIGLRFLSFFMRSTWIFLTSF